VFFEQQSFLYVYGSTTATAALFSPPSSDMAQDVENVIKYPLEAQRL
jgi:hypothetical protein